MNAELREEFRREAAGARTYDVYADSLLQARRGRRRAVVAWALLVAVVALAVPWLSRSQPAVPPAGSAAVSLPDRLGLPADGSRGVAGLGAAAVAYTGDGGRFGPFFDEADTYALVGATAEDYRTLHTGLAYDHVLLSPDGTVVAVPDRLVHLSTGDERPLPGAPLAWSPDGRRLVAADSRVRIVDVATGATTDLGPVDEWSSAAWSPDGSRLAYEKDHRIIVSDVTGRTLGSFEPAYGSVLAGKGAWTPDGRAVAVVAADARSWAPRWFDPSSGREVAGPALPAVVGETFGGGLLGWRPDGAALAFVPGRRPRLLALVPGATQPVSVLALPSEVTHLDISDRAIESGRVRTGEPPSPIGPRLWARLGVGALGVLVLGWLIRWLRERARMRRIVATPWETTHGPLV